MIVPNVRANKVSIVDLKAALAGESDPELGRIPLVRVDGRVARPKGSAVTPDGQYAVISGGPRVLPLLQEVGYLYVIDLRSRGMVATVTGVGNGHYAVAVAVVER